MTILNRLSRLFGGNAAEQDASRKSPAPAPCEKVMMNDTMRAQLLLTCEQIRHHLAQGGESALWLARSVVSSYRPPALIPVLIGRSAKPNKEAYALFERLLMIRSAGLTTRQQNWDESDELFAALVEECGQHLISRLEEINETR
ncbi:TPA: hypothetical protein ACSP15_003553 [Aeromonas veronii]